LVVATFIMQRGKDKKMPEGADEVEYPKTAELVEELRYLTASVMQDRVNTSASNSIAAPRYVDPTNG
jgi:hypothetical protein